MKFTATEFSSIEEKEKFERHFKKFVQSGFKRTMFKNWFYKRLSMTFGHIAHYNQENFYQYFFATREGRIEFLQQCFSCSCCGDPAYTFSDVERNLQDWMQVSGLCQGLVKVT